MGSGGYAIVLDLSQRVVVIVGGGSVALRKARGLLESGATRIRVVAPVIHPEMPAAVQRVEDVYRGPQQLGDASLVFAATDRADVNDAVVRDAHAIGALACRADVEEASDAADFSTPAILRDGPILITVSTGGSPALSAMIRDQIKSAIDPRWMRLAEAMQQLRPVLRQKLTPARRRELFRSICCDEAMDELSKRGFPGLREWIARKFPELNELNG